MPSARKKRSTMRQLTPWFFLFPAMVIFVVYVIYPIIDSIWLSFYQWDGLGDKTWVGLDNYVELFESDAFYTSLKNNFLWLVFFMIAPPAGLAIALFLNQQVKGIRVVKSLFFFPFVISQVVVGLVFAWFYDPTFGLFNIALNGLGLEPIAILSNEKYVTYGIIAAGLWPQISYCMILYLTGLNNLDPEQIEAARLDGAKKWRMLWYVVLPQLRPATFIAIVVTVIGALRSFDLVATMTAGGPWGSSSVLAYQMYEESIFNYRMGFGAAVSVVLFLIMDVYIAYFLWRMLRSEK
ncbi:putative ABC-type sugar transport system,permease component [Vibrio nigripulchritudo MADA3029]|uniref:ABC-type sugar transport system,permease component n=2 Tax=Vibrio nigripulchritudo TaxID=28173 RepID=A0AAV2VSQ7_9VIBR|nr:ABC transporter substrate binding inner membrane protein [Vibrio nigripulchritudo ATCC 27043]CCN34147.1 putative ABC-type sugar transport system,permease component [Vibrio nigripulchritudo AM115]CCN49912.1 putative ABC-type sugar transport system,permease component [Vibrio nigripulchritudo MADA3020]CCN56446.1 putative ABC-type sugar transport system,permease component [Vibrio nigripulchritudo MADA3021]CCN62061.1 putative ABC-type sugar transport system,permease component [Vibrio nigripulchri